MIDGSQYNYYGNNYERSDLFRKNRAAIHDGFQTLFKNHDYNKKPVEYTHLLSRAKVIGMKELVPVGDPEYPSTVSGQYDSREQFQALNRSIKK